MCAPVPHQRMAASSPDQAPPSAVHMQPSPPPNHQDHGFIPGNLRRATRPKQSGAFVVFSERPSTEWFAALAPRNVSVGYLPGLSGYLAVSIRVHSYTIAS